MSSQSDSRCPICGSAQFETRRSARHQTILTHSCPVCDLRCEVVESTETPPLEMRISAWKAKFSQD